jgi:hypothetical protein
MVAVQAAVGILEAGAVGTPEAGAVGIPEAGAVGIPEGRTTHHAEARGKAVVEDPGVGDKLQVMTVAAVQALQVRPARAEAVVEEWQEPGVGAALQVMVQVLLQVCPEQTAPGHAE